jgi:hypothetical protein
MIIWRGRGWLVALITFVSALVINAAVDQIGGKGYWDAHDWTLGLALILSALLVFILSRRIDTSERVLLDERTGERLLVSPKHDLFWIPVKWWPVILGVIGAWALAANALGLT